MDNNTRRYANNDWCYEQCRRRRCRGIYHMIQQGDTLYSLSRQYKVSVDAIMRANPGINIYNLHINDELCIPVMTNNRPMPVPGMPMNNNMPLDFTFEYMEDEQSIEEWNEFGRTIKGISEIRFEHVNFHYESQKGNSGYTGTLFYFVMKEDASYILNYIIFT